MSAGDITAVAVLDGMEPRKAAAIALALYASLPSQARISVRILLRDCDQGEREWAFERIGRFTDRVLAEITQARVDAAG